MLPEISKAQVVLIGKFNPSDFVPKILIQCGIIDEQSLADVVWNTFIPSQSLDLEFPWGQLVVNQHQFIVTANETPHIAASDFARSTMANASGENKVVAMGINFDAHFKLEYFYQRNAIGTRLVPPSAWGQWGEGVKEQIDASIDPIKQGGMTNVIMRKFRDDNELHGYTDVRVQASNEFPKTGVFIAVNDHYQIDSRPTYTAADLIRSDLVDYKADLMLVLEKNFDASITASRKIMDGVLGGE